MAKWELLRRPEATNDGSGMVALDIQGITDEGAVIPGRHQTVLVSEDGLDAALALPRQQAVQAVKELVRLGLPATGWENEELEEIITANTDAQDAAVALNEFLTVTLGLEYGIKFSL